MDRKSESGVIYVAHLPWGFEEQGLKDYFSQFGKVTKLRLARSRKVNLYAFTGTAFFSSPELLWSLTIRQRPSDIRPSTICLLTL